MKKFRINKLIFQDGRIFLRIKISAKNIKINKDGTNYNFEFFLKGAKKIVVPVVFLDNFTSEQPIYEDALNLGYVIDEKTPIKEFLQKTQFQWGELICFNSALNKSEYFYLKPDDQKWVVRVGPIGNDIEGMDLEIDWSNVQWGLS